MKSGVILMVNCKHEGPKKGHYRFYYCIKCKKDICSKHPTYKVMRKPIGSCAVCWALWFQKQTDVYMMHLWIPG
jgi:hypothetical protein